MTVSTSINSVVYRGNGAATQFAVPFKVLDADHLVVTRRVFTTGVLDYTYVGTDYTYGGIGDDAGTLTLDGPALDDAYELVIERIVPYTQDLDIVNAGGFYPETVEEQLDLITMGIQQIAALAGRGAVVPIGEDGPELPKASDRAGKFFAFDADGQLVMSEGTGADAGLRTDLAGDGGAALVGFTQNVIGAVKRSLASAGADAPLKLEDFGGGPGATAAENAAALVAIGAKLAGATRAVIQLLDGDYLMDAAFAPTSVNNLVFQGMSRRTSLRQTNANLHGIILPVGHNIDVTFRDFILYGAGATTTYSGTGKGIYQAAGGDDSFGLTFDNVWFYNWGSDCINLANCFTTEYLGCEFNYSGGNGIVAGGNTHKVDTCYIHNLPAAGAVGFKFVSGQVKLFNCNGVDGCDVWGQFGTSVSDGDAANQYCGVSIDSCNVEDFGTIGADLRNGNLRSVGTPYTGKANTGGLIAIRARSLGQTGFLDNAGSFALKSGAAWSHNCPVHALDTLVPFSGIGGGATNKMNYWSVDAGPAAMRSMAVMNASAQAVGADGYDTSHLKVTDQLWSSGNVFETGLRDFADDAAAAAGTPPVGIGGAYLTGSVRKVRRA